MAENEFLNIIDEKVAAESKAAETQPNEFLPIIDAVEKDKGVQFRNAMSTARDTDPDAYAKQVLLSKRTGIPMDVVSRNQDMVEKQAPFLSGEYDALTETNPTTVKFLTREDNAKFAKNDIPELTVMEQIAAMNDRRGFMKTMSDSFMSGLSSINVGIAQSPALVYNAYAALYNAAATPQNFVADKMGRPDQKVQMGTAPDWLINNPVANYYKKAAEYYAPEELHQDPIELMKQGNGVQAARTIAAQVVANLPQQIFLVGTTLMGQPEIGLAGMGVLSASQATAQAQENGKSPLMATLDAIGQGSIEVATERFGTVGIIHHWENALIKSFGKTTAKQVIADVGKSIAAAFFQEGGEEFVAQIGQDFVDYATGNPDAYDSPDVEGVRDDGTRIQVTRSGGIGTAIQRAMNSFLIGGFSGGLVTAPTVLTTAGIKSARSSADGKFWDDFMAASAESKLRQRSPEKFAEFTGDILKDGQRSPNIYVSNEALQTFFQNDPEGLNKFLNDMDIKDQLADAANTGKEFEISAAKFASLYAGSPLSQALRPDMRFDLNGMTQREQTQLQQEYAKMVLDMQQEYATLVQEQKLPPEIQTMRDKMMLPKEAGGAGFSAEEVDAQLSVFMAGLSSFARKAGLPLDQYVRKVNPVLNVGGEFVDIKAPSNDPNTFQQARPIDYTDPVNVQYRDLISQGGGQFIGTQPGFVKKSTGETTEGLVMFNDPETNTTLVLKPSQLTAEAVAQRIAASRQQFQKEQEQRLFQQDDIEITPAKISSVNWSKVNSFMKRKGYDLRGAEDAKEVFKRIFDRHQGKLPAAVYPDHAAALEYGSSKKVQSLQTKAKRTFGITPYFEEAGYLMPDGALLDFSGRKDGYVGPPERNVDHREIHRVYPDDAFPEDNVGTQNMIDFMNRGNIRLQSNGADISTVNALTPAQERMLARHIQKNKGEYSVDFSDPKGNTVDSRDYPLGTNPARILNDIRAILKTSNGQDTNTLFQTDELGFFSKLQQVIEEKMPNSAPAQQIEGILAGSGVKQDEMDWMGIKEFLAGKAKVTKEDLLQFIEGNRVQLKQVTLGYVPKQGQSKVIAERDSEELRKRIQKKAEELQQKALQEASDEWWENYDTYDVPDGSNIEELDIDDERLDLTEAEREDYKKRLRTADVGQPDLFGEERKPVPAPGFFVEFAGEEIGVFKTEAEAQAAYDQAQQQYDDNLRDEAFREFQRDWEHDHDVESFETEAREALDLNEDDVEREPRFQNYILDNGANYREVLLTLPPATTLPAGYSVTENPSSAAKPETKFIVLGPGNNELGGFANRYASGATAEEAIQNFNKDHGQTFRSSHFNDLNILAHFRLTERDTALGRTLFIEEIQSDWHQQGRSKGYRKNFTESYDVLASRVEQIEAKGNEATPEEKREWADIKSFLEKKGVADAPFKKTWHELASKRILRMAVEEGYDALAWTTGEQQVERYESALRSAVDVIRWTKTEQGVQLIGYKKSRYITPSGNDVPGAPESFDEVVNTTERETALSDAIGKAMAEKILSSPEQTGEIQGEDIKISDTGMAGFYDRIIPQFLSKYTKKWGGKVGTTEIDTKGVIEKPADEQGRKFLTQGDIKAKVHSLPITQEMRDSLLEGQPLFQGENKPRGSVQFTDAATIINLYNSANLSTFVHEAGHIFMKEMQKLIDAGVADPQTVIDYQTLKTFVGGNINSRAAQEKLARAFEAYLKEGKAPSVKLVEAFRRFRDWLTAIYRAIRGLNVEINDEVRGVFDRILAAEAEIEEAKDFYRARKSLLDLMPDATPEQKAKVAKAKNESEQAALEKAVKERLNIYLRLQGGKQAIREQATKEIDATPIYKAIAEATDKGGLDAAVLKATYGKETVEKLRDTHEGIAKYEEKTKNKKGSFDPAKAPTLGELAVAHGFGSEQEMMQAMLKTPRRSVAITERAKQILQGKEAELLRDLKGEEQVAGEENLHNAKSLTYLITEAEILSQRIAAAKNRRPDIIEEKLYKSVAAEVIGKKQVRQAIRYDLYARAEQRYARMAEEALIKGDLDVALEAKKKQLLNHAMVLMAIEARDEKRKIDKFFQSKNYKAKLANTENDFAEASMDISSFIRIGPEDLLPKTPGALDKIKEVDEFLSSTIPEWIRLKQLPPNFKDYRDLTMNQLREAFDAVKAVLQYGSNEMKSIEAGEAKTLQEWVDASVKEMEKLKDRDMTRRDESSKLSKPLEVIDSFAAGASLVQFTSDWMDNFSFFNTGNAGPFKKLYNKVLQAEIKYTDLRTDVVKEAKAAWETLGNAARRIAETNGAHFDIQGVPLSEDMRRTKRAFWTVNRMIAFLLNTGNASNLEVLKRAYGYTDQQIQKIASYFTEAELKAVQKIWDATDLLFPQLDETHFSIYNRHLPKIAAQSISFQTADGKTVKLDGGYYPLVFDHRLSDRAAKFQEDDLMQNMTQAVIRSSKPEDGMTYSRTPGHSLPPLLETHVWFSHLNATARYISHAKILRDLNRFTRDKEWSKMMKRKAGDDHYKAIRTWLQFNANPSRRLLTTKLDLALDWMRSLSTAAILGFKTAVGLKQRTALISAAQAMGKESAGKGWGWILKAYKEVDLRVSGLGLSQSKTWEETLKKSPYLKTRDGNIDREISDMRRGIDPLEKKYKIGNKEFTPRDIQDFAFEWIKMNDRATVAVVWTAAYNQYVAEKADQKATPEQVKKAAIAYADGIVQDTQASSLTPELSNLQKQEGWVRLFTMFMTSAMNYGNRVIQNYRAWNQGAISNKEFFNHVLQEYVAMPYAAYLISLALRGGEPPEWWQFLMVPFEQLASFIPLLRDAFSYFNYGTDIGKSSIFEPAARTLKAVKSTAQFVFSDGEFTKAAWDIGRAVEVYTKVPALNFVKEVTDTIKNLTD